MLATAARPHGEWIPSDAGYQAPQQAMSFPHSLLLLREWQVKYDCHVLS